MDSPKALASHLGAKITLLSAVVISAVMVLNTVLHYWNIRRLTEARDMVLHTSEKIHTGKQNTRGSIRF